ncbi:MAG: hypothetical protein HKO53_14635 [Gemmatimonadetes bacterium]|nr:hypothetical protein [Gemmatimonadota bacterium]
MPPSLVTLAAEAEPDATPPGEASRPTLTGSDGTDPRPAVTPSPTTRDDLTRIRGVGPVLQRKLREMGVVSLEEIASWTPDDVARVQARLSGFPDRIRRDRWVDQARDLLSENR